MVHRSVCIDRHRCLESSWWPINKYRSWNNVSGSNTIYKNLNTYHYNYGYVWKVLFFSSCFLTEYNCVCMYVCLCVCVHACMCTFWYVPCGSQRTASAVILQAQSTLLFETQSLTGLDLAECAELADCKLRASVCLCLPSTRTTSTCHHTRLFVKNVGSGDQIQMPKLARQLLCWLSAQLLYSFHCLFTMTIIHCCFLCARDGTQNAILIMHAFCYWATALTLHNDYLKAMQVFVSWGKAKLSPVNPEAVP